MKQIFLSIAAMMLLNINLSNAELLTDVKANGSEKTLSVELNNEDTGATIRLKDQFGETLHEQTVNKVAYKAKFDLRSLPIGEYHLTITSRNEKSLTYHNYPVSIENDMVILGEETVEKVFTPQIVVKENKLVMNMLSLNKSTSVRAVFANANGEVIHTDLFTATNSKGKIYNIELLPSGTYTATFYYEEEVVRTEFVR